MKASGEVSQEEMARRFPELIAALSAPAGEVDYCIVCDGLRANGHICAAPAMMRGGRFLVGSQSSRFAVTWFRQRLRRRRDNIWHFSRVSLRFGHLIFWIDQPVELGDVSS